MYKEEYSGAIGIDLGTTYSCVAVWQNDRVEIIPNDQGNRTTPSYVAFTEAERLIGDHAKAQVSINPTNTVFDAKRLIGRRFDDETVQSDMQHWPFKIVNKEGKPVIEVMYKSEARLFSPEEISAMVLTKMKEVAEAHLGKSVFRAVVTVPAYFNDSQRQATKDAGSIAGLDVIRIINEPTAAAIAYGLNLDSNLKEERNILIFDLGGGTFDVSVLSIESGVFEVKATNGNTHLGGEDFDNRLVDHFAEEFKRRHKLDVLKNAKALRRLRSACEAAKRNLSSATTASIQLDSLMDGIDFMSQITRAKFEQINGDLFKNALEPVRKVLLDAKLEKSQIHDVVLVGGSTRIPKMQELLSDFFAGKELNKSINPDEAVAHGAAVQAAVLSGLQKNLLLIDVTPLSLGIETTGGLMSKLIERNSSIPCVKTKSFTTFENGQETVLVQVYEGERPLTRDNNLLGRFELTNIPSMPRGKPKIDVTFEIDANGIMQVSAREVSTGNQNHVVIANDKGRLSQLEIEEMLREANRMRQDDGKRLRSIHLRNGIEAFVFKVKTSLENRDGSDNLQFPVNEKEEIGELVTQLSDWLEEHHPIQSDPAVFEEKIAEIERVASKFASLGTLFENERGVAPSSTSCAQEALLLSTEPIIASQQQQQQDEEERFQDLD